MSPINLSENEFLECVKKAGSQDISTKAQGLAKLDTETDTSKYNYGLQTALEVINSLARRGEPPDTSDSKDTAEFLQKLSPVQRTIVYNYIANQNYVVTDPVKEDYRRNQGNNTDYVKKDINNLKERVRSLDDKAMLDEHLGNQENKEKFLTFKKYSDNIKKTVKSQLVLAFTKNIEDMKSVSDVDAALIDFKKANMGELGLRRGIGGKTSDVSADTSSLKELNTVAEKKKEELFHASPSLK